MTYIYVICSYMSENNNITKNLPFSYQLPKKRHHQASPGHLCSSSIIHLLSDSSPSILSSHKFNTKILLWQRGTHGLREQLRSKQSLCDNTPVSVVCVDVKSTSKLEMISWRGHTRSLFTSEYGA